MENQGLLKKGKQQQKWEKGELYRIALHTAVGGLSGGMQGAAGAAAAAGAAPILDDLQDSLTKGLENAGANANVAKAAAQLISGITAAGIGSVAGGGSTTGAATAFNTDANNRQLHPTEIQWITQNARRYAQQKGISPQEAEKQLAQQAYRQVQDGAAGNWDADASHFLKQAHGMLPADGSSGPGYLFQATATQKADADMYANQLPQTAAFYEKNGIESPTVQQAADATRRSNAIRDTVAKATVGAAALAAATTLPPALSFCLSNPVACNQIVIAGGEIAAGDALGPAGLAIGGVAAGKMGLKSMQSAEQARSKMVWRQRGRKAHQSLMQN